MTKKKSGENKIILLIIGILVLGLIYGSRQIPLPQQTTDSSKSFGRFYIYNFDTGVFIKKVYILNETNSRIFLGRRIGIFEQPSIFIDCGLVQQDRDVCENSNASRTYTSRLNKGLTPDSYFQFLSPSKNITIKQSVNPLSVGANGRLSLQEDDGSHLGYEMTTYNEVDLTGDIGEIIQMIWYIKVIK